MKLLFLSAIAIIAGSGCEASACRNSRPIIGILAQPLTNKNILKEFSFTQGKSHMHASYVKWLESGGARVVPIKDGMDKKALNRLLASINGVVFPGGISNLGTSKYAKTGRDIFEYAIKAKNFPIMGICLGFQLLIKLTSKRNLLQRTYAKRISMKMNINPHFRKSRMFSGLSSSLRRLVTQDRLAYNSHNWGIYPRVFKKNRRLRTFYNILTTSKDTKGVEFVAAMEAKRYPIFGVQWHPEKISYEWHPILKINRSPEAIQLAQFMTNTFVKEAMNNCNRFESKVEEKRALIYSHYPLYTGEVSTVEQTYVFE